MHKKALSERDICTKFITPALRRAGWDEMLQIREEVSFTKGRIIVRGKLVSRGQANRADYVLYFKPNIPLALIEAKDIELTRFAYQANAWCKPRWVVGIRQHIERRAAPKGKTLNLFADDRKRSFNHAPCTNISSVMNLRGAIPAGLRRVQRYPPRQQSLVIIGGLCHWQCGE